MWLCLLFIIYTVDYCISIDSVDYIAVYMLACCFRFRVPFFIVQDGEGVSLVLLSVDLCTSILPISVTISGLERDNMSTINQEFSIGHCFVGG